MTEKIKTVLKETFDVSSLKKGSLKAIASVDLSSMIEQFKTLGQIVLFGVVYTDKDVQPSIGSNVGRQFVEFLAPNQTDRLTIGFTLFSRLMYRANLSDSILWADDNAEKTFNSAWEGEIKSIYRNVKTTAIAQQKKKDEKKAKSI